VEKRLRSIFRATSVQENKEFAGRESETLLVPIHGILKSLHTIPPQISVSKKEKYHPPI
jgi:hypothetical protein